MNPMIERLLTSAAAALAVSLVAHPVAAVPFPVLLTVVLLGFVTAGTAAAVLAEWLAGRVLSGGRPDGVRAYFIHLFLFALSGFVFFVLVWFGLYGPGDGRRIAWMAAVIGVPSMLVYYHISFAIRFVWSRKHDRTYGTPVETERLVLLPCTMERYKEARKEGYPMGDHVEAYIESLRTYPYLLGWGVWLVRLKETGEVIGDIGFKGNPDGNGAVDIGYGFLPQHRGKGYATEAAKALVDWAFEHGAGRVTAETLRDNHASIRVLRKTGFHLYREAEHYYWRIDAAEWRQAGAGGSR